MRCSHLTILTLALALWGGAIYAEDNLLLFPNSDFEAGDLSHWRTEGKAFLTQPTLGDSVHVRESDKTGMLEGSYWVNTYMNYQGKKGQNPKKGIQRDKPVGGLISEPFLIKHPYMTFLVGAGKGADVGVQLIVGGKVVYACHGNDEEMMRRVYWDVSPWLNEQAMLYLIDHSDGPWGHVNADDFRFAKSLPDRKLFPNSDFEQEDLSNWLLEAEEGVFVHQPRPAKKNPAEAIPSGEEAGKRYLISRSPAQAAQADEKEASETEEKKKGNTVRSIPFTINGRVLSFEIGGGESKDTGVHLLLYGQPIKTAHGPGEHAMQAINWNVSDYLGREMEIEIFDNDATEGMDIAVDNFHYGVQ